MAGPAAAATNTSEMARRFRTAVVSMGRPRVIGVGRPHAPGLFRDDCVKCCKHTVPERTQRTAAHLAPEMGLLSRLTVIDDPASGSEDAEGTTAHCVSRARPLNVAGASRSTRTRGFCGVRPHRR